ncbi:MAG TPA: Dam family site-specific DNA-(adenine-N6)-methyltransferase, partial [Blastocatellia bacterium]|nr:Dam family site-specific DNA-(adenine-N6)-methyltransferase [Blastocatellia bacterium]
MHSFLRWAGSKRKLLPVLLDLVPLQFDRYVEPFAGSACLFFSLQPGRAILSDINDELISTYREVTLRTEEVIGYLSALELTKDAYYRVRAVNPYDLSGPLRAARFIYLNRLCFNGLYRTNKRGEFNVPFGGYRCGPIPSADSLRTSAVLLRRATLVSCSFEQTLDRVKSGDFIYLDPPYCIRSRRVFNEYSHFSFGSDQLAGLRQHLDRLDRMGIPFLVSYGASWEGREL